MLPPPTLDIDQIALWATIGLALGLGIWLGYRSGKKKRQAEWVGFLIGTGPLIGIAVLGMSFAGQWANWKQQDDWVTASVASGTLISITPDYGFDTYNVRYPNTSTGSIRRYHFRIEAYFPFVQSVFLGVFGATVGLGARAITLRRTTKPGHCLSCGYNLTGAPHACCPECGAAIASGAGRSNIEQPVKRDNS